MKAAIDRLDLVSVAKRSVERYAREFIAPHPDGAGYMGSIEGPEAIQFLRSREADYAPGCLRDGRFAASYDPGIDPATDAFVKMTWNVFKKFAHRTFVVNRETGLVNEKREPRFLRDRIRQRKSMARAGTI